MLYNEPNTSLAKFVARLSFIVCAFLTTAAFASCEEGSEDDYYGNAELCAFKNSVEGTEALSSQDQAYLGSVDVTRLTNRSYMKIFIGKPKSKLSSIEFSNATVFTGAPSQPSINNKLLQGTLAGGYIWEHWAIEGELYTTKKLTFSENPFGVSVANGVPVNATLDVKQYAIFVNGEFIFPRYFSWYPRRLQVHLNAGAGGVIKMTDTSTFNLNGTPRQSSSSRKISPAGNLGAGIRYQITSNLLVDIAYRFFSMGKTTFSIEGAKVESNKLQSTGWFLGAMYEF